MIRQLEEWRLELTQAVRRLRKSPGYSIAILVSLSLGIGAASAIFALLDSALLRPLAYPNSDRMVRIATAMPGLVTEGNVGVAAHEFFYFARASHTIEKLVVYRDADLTVTAGAERLAQRVQAAFVSANIFDVLALHLQLGRAFTEADNASELPTVGILSNAYWHRRFGADLHILGKSVDVEGISVTIVGVLNADDALPTTNPDLWLPLYLTPMAPAINQHDLVAVGTIRRGATVNQVRQELRNLTGNFPTLFPQAYPRSFWEKAHLSTVVTPLRQAIVGEAFLRALWILFSGVLLLLLIALSNAGGLTLVRAESHRREAAVRVALGAGSTRMLGYYFAEGLILAMLAGAIGFGASLWALQIASRLPWIIPGTIHLSLHWPTGCFEVLAIVVATLVLGCLPLPLHVRTIGAAAATLREGHGVSSSQTWQTVRAALVVVQVALAVVLLVSAGLLVKTMHRLREVRLGFHPEGVLLVPILPPTITYARESAVFDLYRELINRVQALPNVATAAVAQLGPFDPLLQGSWCQVVHFEGMPPSAQAPCVLALQASPGFLETLGIRVEGELPTWGGVENGASGALISRHLAARIWPGQSGLGRGARPFKSASPYYPISGLLGDVRMRGLDQPVSDLILFPIKSRAGIPLWAPTQMTLAVRVRSGSPLSIAHDVRQAVASIDPSVAIGEEISLNSRIERSISRQLAAASLLSISAGIAIALSLVGLSGVIAYMVELRRKEIGIRIALGATRVQVVELVSWYCVKIVSAGIGLGLCLTVAFTRYLQSLLFGVGPTDTATLYAATLGTALLGVAAVFVPLSRAMRVDPVIALRND